MAKYPFNEFLACHYCAVFLSLPKIRQDKMDLLVQADRAWNMYALTVPAMSKHKNIHLIISLSLFRHSKAEVFLITYCLTALVRIQHALPSDGQKYLADVMRAITKSK